MNRQFDSNRSQYRRGRSSATGEGWRDRNGSQYGTGRESVSRDDRSGDYERDHNRRSGETFMEKVGRFFGVGPKGYQRSDDRIREDVCEALYADPDVDASNIEVEVKSGIVTLTGSVESRADKRRAEECVEYVTGVKDGRGKHAHSQQPDRELGEHLGQVVQDRDALENLSSNLGPAGNGWSLFILLDYLLSKPTTALKSDVLLMGLVM